jgi:hypothetical protein
MGAAKKNRRRITVNNRLFLWSLSDSCSVIDKNNPPREILVYATLHIVSHDKRLIVEYGLGSLPALHERYLTVISPTFPGLAHKNPGPIYLRTPQWTVDDVVSPAFVRCVIEWCLDENKTILEVDKYGKAFDTMQKALGA